MKYKYGQILPENESTTAEECLLFDERRALLYRQLNVLV